MWLTTAPPTALPHPSWTTRRHELLSDSLQLVASPLGLTVALVLEQSGSYITDASHFARLTVPTASDAPLYALSVIMVYSTVHVIQEDSMQRFIAAYTAKSLAWDTTCGFFPTSHHVQHTTSVIL